MPSVTFRLKQVSGDPLRALSLNVVFIKMGDRDDEPHDDVFVQQLDIENGETKLITARSEFGYTADPPQTQLDILNHSQFRDMEAQILVKYGIQWIELHRVRVERRLLER